MRTFIVLLASLGWIISSTTDIHAGTPEVAVYTGAFYTRGTYSGQTLEDIYIPLSIRVSGDRFGYRLTVPYLMLDLPEDNANLPQEPSSTTYLREEGVGDVVASITAYNVVRNDTHRFAVDFTGKVKVATADSERGMGTGENDYEFQGELYKFFKRFTLYYTSGYKIRGDPEGIDLDNAWFHRLGGTHGISPKVKAGVLYSYRQSSIENLEAIEDVSGFISVDVNTKWQIQLHGLSGLSDTSPDWEAGFLLKLKLQ